MKVKIKRLDPTVHLPEYNPPHAAACFDIACFEDVVIQPKEIRRVRTGLVVETPEHYLLALFPRSSTPLAKGLMFPHSVGIVDPTYSGPNDEILIQVYNFTDKPAQIKKGERIAQGAFLQSPQIEWEEVTEIQKNSRGGFGSTGGHHA